METIFFKYSLNIIYSLNRTMQYGNKQYWQKKTGSKYRLNRTMQYGNFHLCNAPNFRIPVCLNRTMQYGNDVSTQVGCEDKMCLNRTMQYGNLSDFTYSAAADSV